MSTKKKSVKNSHIGKRVVYVGPSSRGIPRGHQGCITEVIKEGPSPRTGICRVPQIVEVHWDKIPGTLCQITMSSIGIADIREADDTRPIPPQLPRCSFPSHPGIFVCKRREGTPDLSFISYDEDGELHVRTGISNFPLKQLDSSTQFWGPLYLEEPFGI